MDEGKGIGSQTHSAGLLPAVAFRTRSPRRTVAPPNVAPPHLPHRISLRKRRGRGNAHRTPSQVWRARGRHGACVAHTSCAPPPSVRFSVRHMHKKESLLFVPQAELARAARAWQRPKLHVSPRVERAVHGRRGACVAQLQHRMKIEADSTVYPAMPVVWKAFTWSVAPSTVPPE